MKTNNNTSLFPGAALAAALALSAFAQDTNPATPAPWSAERSVLTTVTAKVEAIDQAKREVTLKGPLGNVVTFVVDQRVTRLKDVKVGDEVTADYYVSVAGEVRAPTEEEKNHPYTILDNEVRAPKGTSPAARGLRAIRVVAKVIGLDLPTQTVTLEGATGNTGSIRMENVSKLERLHLGDTVVVTYTEALAISLRNAQHEATKE